MALPIVGRRTKQKCTTANKWGVGVEDGRMLKASQSQNAAGNSPVSIMKFHYIPPPFFVYPTSVSLFPCPLLLVISYSPSSSLSLTQNDCSAEALLAVEYFCFASLTFPRAHQSRGRNKQKKVRI